MTAPAPAGDTIFARSSGGLPAAIAIVRVSGPDAGKVLERLAGFLPEPRHTVLARLNDHEGSLLDRALIMWFPGPSTATGEDLAELHLHGGRATVASVLSYLSRQPGLRAAAPGEFTRRALAHGRLDLAQVEGLADLLAAETEAQRRAALRLAEGGLTRLVEDWSDRLLALSAEVEAAIEFAEEHEDVPHDTSGIAAGVATLSGEIATALASPPAERLHDGIRVVVAGPVNAGKSSLVNALSGREAAIATPIAGTTRDVIEVPVILDGTAFILIDSAGLRETDDEVERIGVKRAERAIAGADIVLWLGRQDNRPTGSHVIRLHAQCDRDEDKGLSSADIAVSAVTGEGLAALRNRLLVEAEELLPNENLALNHRQRHLLMEAAEALARVSSTTEYIMLAEELRLACSAINGITGRLGVENMLDRLFSRFCIGK